jgi:hypothetical protein
LGVFGSERLRDRWGIDDGLEDEFVGEAIRVHFPFGLHGENHPLSED